MLIESQKHPLPFIPNLHAYALCNRHYWNCAITVSVQGYFQQILGTHKFLYNHEKNKLTESAKYNPAQ